MKEGYNLGEYRKDFPDNFIMFGIDTGIPYLEPRPEVSYMLANISFFGYHYWVELRRQRIIIFHPDLHNWIEEYFKNLPK